MEWKPAARNVLRVLQQPWYALFGGVAAVGAFMIYALLLNYMLLGDALAAGDFSLFFNLVPPLVTGYVETTTPVSVVLSVLVSLAIGANIALVMYRLIELSEIGRETVSSLGGAALAVIAPACPACATAIFAVAGVSTFFAILPFHGMEIKVLALILLAGSALWIAARINDEYCEFC